MTENLSFDDSEGWKRFLRRHWGAALAAGAATVLVALGSVLVLLWYAGEAQASGLVPAGLGAWSLGTVVDFLLHLIFWEVVLVAAPAAVAAIIGWYWWSRLPAVEKAEYERGGKKKKKDHKSDAGNGFSFLLFLVFLLKVYLDGNWNLPLSSWTFDYLIDSAVWVFAVVAVVFGIPLLIGGLWWLRRQMRRAA